MTWRLNFTALRKLSFLIIKDPFNWYSYRKNNTFYTNMYQLSIWHDCSAHKLHNINMFQNIISACFFTFRRWKVLRQTHTNTGRITGIIVDLVRITVCQGWGYSKLEPKQNTSSAKTSSNRPKFNLTSTLNPAICTEACLPHNFKWV